MMVPSPASLLALASSLEAQGDALKAQAASIRAAIESSAQAPASDAITLEAATALLGSKRKARETFAAFEREGFEVRRVGHAAFMDRAEWDRAIASRSSKRATPPSVPTAPTSSPTANDDESPASILARAGLVPSRGAQPQRRAPKRRAA
jgi:hypothetical protein